MFVEFVLLSQANTFDSVNPFILIWDSKSPVAHFVENTGDSFVGIVEKNIIFFAQQKTQICLTES